MATSVTKADGTRQLFDKEKILKTCLRMGATPTVALEIANQVETQLYEGITTQKILSIIFSLMRKPKPALRHVFDLKQGISRMEPKPEFEVFVRVLLAHSGFQVKPNMVLRGLCGEHEADAIASKDDENYFVEAKHHCNYHALTGLDESRIARAVIEDLTEGYQNGVTGIKIDRAIIVTNTRFSEHAIKYGTCRGIMQVGWNTPESFGLRDLIQKHKLYPISCLKGVSTEVRLRLVDVGIVLIRQLLEQDCHYLARTIGLPQKTVLSILERAKHTTETLWQQA